MKLKILILVLISLTNYSIAQKYSQTGLASYYGKKFHGKKTANGERFDMKAFTSAHKTLPFNSLVRVTNLSNGKTVIVRVNDRGPVSKSRIIDLSKAAAEKIDMVSKGIVRVKVELLDPDDMDNNEKMLSDCCYGEIGELSPIFKYDFYGNKFKTDGAGIAEEFEAVFDEKYIETSFSKINIEAIAFSTPKKRGKK